MHSAFLWYSCYCKGTVADLGQLVKPFVSHDDLPEFFWMHLQKDIEQLSKLIGKGPEEAAMIIHLVLKNILTKNPPGKRDQASLCHAYNLKISKVN